jgi:guanylate kinase
MEGNNLKHLSEFQQLLGSYRISEKSKAILNAVDLVLLVAPTSTGRNTIISELLKSGKYYHIISDTTRQPRANNGVIEKNGEVYWFQSEQDMLDELRSGNFIEVALIHHQQVSGVSLRELNKAAESGKIAITDVDTVGARRIHELKWNSHIIYVLPPSFDEWLRRLNDRGGIVIEEQKRRLASAHAELLEALHERFYWFVVNEDVSTAAAQVDSIAHAASFTPTDTHSGRQLAQRLLDQLTDYLNTNHIPLM